MSYNKRVLELIEAKKETLVKLLQDLIRFRSITGNEGGIAKYLAAKLQNLGFEVTLVEAEKDRPNVIALLKGITGRRRLLCYGHTDVVPPGDPRSWNVDPFGGEIVGEKIYGRGAQDHKFPIAAFMVAIEAIQEAGLRLEGDLMFTFVADEEPGGYKGLKYLVENGYFDDTDAMIYGGTGGGNGKSVTIAGNGQKMYDITILGKTAHTSTLEEGVNAIVKAAKIVLALQGLANKVNRQTHPLTGHARMSVNVIRGGEADNVLPDKCVITVDRRVTPSEDCDEVTRQIKAVLERLKKQDRQMQIKVDERAAQPSYECPADSEIVKVLQDAGACIIGRRPGVKGSSASMDCAWYANTLRKPVGSYVISTAKSLAHASNEYALIPDLVKTAQAYAIAIMEYLGVEHAHGS